MAGFASRLLGLQALHELDFRGQGQIVAICDTGLDRGSVSDLPPSMAGKVQRIFAYGRDIGDDPDGHGTHVAGCIVADGESQGFGRILGAAPGALLVVQSVFRKTDEPFGNRPTSMARLLRQGYVEGARVHSNSWIHAKGANNYTVQAQDIDRFVWEHRDLVVILAAGNEGRYDDSQAPAKETMRSPATAKNGISVGASESNRVELSRTYAEFFPKKFHASMPPDVLARRWGGNAVPWLAPFSGRGPVKDNRYKPDLVAPATSIVSVQSRRCKEIRSVWGSTRENGFEVLGGTSMAAAFIAGCAAVVRQFLAVRKNLANPSAALVRALLINGAKPVGQRNADRPDLPNHAQGWGQANVETSLLRPRLWVRDEGTPLRLGEKIRFKARMASTDAPLDVTLAWTDPPGPGLMNDLDLVVQAGAAEHHGNQRPGSLDFDRVNNSERVRLEAAGVTEVFITVQATRLSGPPQTFAMAIDGDLVGEPVLEI